MSTAIELKPAMANAAIFKNPLDTDPADTFEFEAGCTLNEWLDDSGFREFLSITPTLVLLNNEAMLEAEWDTVTQEYDVITLVPQPFITGIEIAALVGFVISILSAGYALYLALTVDTPDPGDEKNSSTYSISYRGNHKRPGQPIPVAYGVCRVYPDLSSEIWSEYDENGDQIKIMLFEFTQGEADITDMRFEETPLSNYQDIMVEVLQPGVSSFVYPNIVNNVAGVTNIELDTLVSSTYVVCPDGQLASYMFLDFVAPQGLWTRSETTGTTFSHQVLIYVEYRIHGSGGAWIAQTKLAPYSMDPWRATGKILFPTPGQYEVRVSRVHPRISEARTADAVFWTGLRAFIHDTTGAPDTTRVAIRMRASDQVGNLALSEFSGVVHRKLPIYNGSWSAPELTGSPVWAFCDACRAAYGGKRPDSYLDMDALVALDSRFGETRPFSGIFETSIPLWQAMQEIARVMLARPIEKPGGQLTMIVDELASGPSAMFTMASIEKDSFKLDQVGYTAQTNDSVTITFKDEVQEYRDTSVTFKPSGSAGTNPADRTLRGVTTLAGAGLVGWRMANENRYRRISATWRTGIEGYLPTYGDTVRVQHWMLGVDLGVTTLSGSIVSKSGSTMYVNEDLSGIGGSGQCYITGSAGSVNGPYNCSVSANSFTVSGDTSAVTFADNLQRPQFIVGRSGDFVSNVKLTSITNVGEHVYELSGFLDNPNAYIEDDVPLNTQLGASDKLTPTIEDLRYTLDGQEHLYDLRLSWREINVDRSQVEQSTDNGSTYQIINEQAHQSHTILGLESGLVTGGNLWYRVTGFNLGAGPSVTINIGAQAYVVPPPTNFVLVREFIGSATIQWDAPPINHRVKIAAWWGGELQRTSISDRAITMADYTWYDSVEDNPGSYLGAVNTTDGARDITFYASTLDDADVESTTVQVDAYNSQIGALTNVQYWELSQGGLRVSYQQPDLPDFYGVEIHLSKTSGFTPDMTYPGSSTRVYAGRQNDITIDGVLDYPDTYYLRMAGVDKWGRDGLVWSDELFISTIDGIFEGEIEWDDMINNPAVFGIQMNVTHFNGSSAPGYFYIHGYAGGVAADITINILCDESVRQIPAMVGTAKRVGAGYLAYDTAVRNLFTVDGSPYNLAVVFYHQQQWYYDGGSNGEALPWDPPAGGLYLIGEIQADDTEVIAFITWTAGRTPQAVVAADRTAWDAVDGKPGDDALLNNPYPLGIKINTETFGNVHSAGYFYIHGYSAGVAVDEPALMMCGNEILSIPSSGTSGMMGFVQHTGRGYIAYDTTGTFFVVEGGSWNLAVVVIDGGVWWYDNGYSLVQWVAPATGVWIIASISSAGAYIADATPWSTGKPPAIVVEENYTYWDNIGSRPTDDDLLNVHQKWEDINTPPDDVWNDNIVWDNLDSLVGTNGRFYNEDTTWQNLGDPDSGTPSEILNENVLYAGLADAPNDSDIYNNLQTYDNLVGLKPPTGATQNGQRGLCFDPDFGLSHANGWAYYFNSFVNTATSVDAGENGTAAAIIQNEGYIYPQKIPCKQGDRFYVLARVKLSSTGLAPGKAIIYAEEYAKTGVPTHGAIIGTSAATTSWQTITCVWDVDNQGTESIRFAPWLTGASGGDTMTVDSFDWWPITEKWTYPNIAYYIDNLAIREAQIGNAAVTNLKVSGNAIFLPAFVEFNEDLDATALIVPSGQSAQEALWTTFGSFWFDMTTSVSGQTLIVHNVLSHGFTIAFRSSAPNVLLDCRIALNGTHMGYFYQADYLEAVTQATYSGSPVVAGEEYGHGVVHNLNPIRAENRTTPILVNDFAFLAPASGMNHVEMQFRIINVDITVTGTPQNPAFVSILADYTHENGRAMFAGGRS